MKDRDGYMILQRTRGGIGDKQLEYKDGEWWIPITEHSWPAKAFLTSGLFQVANKPSKHLFGTVGKLYRSKKLEYLCGVAFHISKYKVSNGHRRSKTKTILSYPEKVRYKCITSVQDIYDFLYLAYTELDSNCVVYRKEKLNVRAIFIYSDHTYDTSSGSGLNVFNTLGIIMYMDRFVEYWKKYYTGKGLK